MHRIAVSQTCGIKARPVIINRAGAVDNLVLAVAIQVADAAIIGAV